MILDEKEQSIIEVDLKKNKNAYEVSVADNGIGIKVKEHKNIFNMFFRGSVISEGSGLGLYIVKETVEKLKGKIQLDSKPGAGTTFSIRLPAKMKNTSKSK